MNIKDTSAISRRYMGIYTWICHCGPSESPHEGSMFFGCNGAHMPLEGPLNVKISQNGPSGGLLGGHCRAIPATGAFPAMEPHSRSPTKDAPSLVSPFIRKRAHSGILVSIGNVAYCRYSCVSRTPRGGFSPASQPRRRPKVLDPGRASVLKKRSRKFTCRLTP